MATKYSLADIDAMREMVRMIVLVGKGFDSPHSVSDVSVEERLRTYMANGSTREELDEHLLEVSSNLFKGNQNGSRR